MELTKNSKILLGVLAVTAIGAGAWFGFVDQASPPPPPATAKPATPPPSTPPVAPAMDKQALMEKLIQTTHISEALGKVPEQILAGMEQSAQANRRANMPGMAQFKQAMAESFTPEGFRNRFRAGLEAGFDVNLAKAVIDAFAAPVHQKLLGLEMANPDQQAMLNFSRELAAHPLPAPRAAMLDRLNSATGASRLAAEASFAAMRAMLESSGRVSADEMRQVEAKLDQMRPVLTERLQEATRLSFAYLYREVSDPDLESYVKAYETPGGRWYSGIVGNAVLEELKAGSVHLGERLAVLLPKPGESRTTAPASASHSTFSGTPRHWHQDARTCLEQTDRQAIIRCANKFY
ncbi:MAG TPA: hypothetical protein PLX46_03340 [Thiobacillaceae bacterium]|nr:hypothetical protein [Thiobacillaceae bacterium]